MLITKKQYEELCKTVKDLAKRIEQVEEQQNKKYIGDITREKNNEKDARDILTEYLYGDQICKK